MLARVALVGSLVFVPQLVVQRIQLREELGAVLRVELAVKAHPIAERARGVQLAVRPARLRPVLIVDGEPARHDRIEEVSAELPGAIREHRLVSGEGLHRPWRQAPAQAAGVELGDVTARERRGQERHARQPLGEPHAGAGDRPGDAGVVGQPGLGAHRAIRDEAAPPLHLCDGRPVDRIERGSNPCHLAQQRLELGVLERTRLDPAQLIQEVFHRRDHSSPAVPGERALRAPERTGVRKTVQQFVASSTGSLPEAARAGECRAEVTPRRTTSCAVRRAAGRGDERCQAVRGWASGPGASHVVQVPRMRGGPDVGPAPSSTPWSVPELDDGSVPADSRQVSARRAHAAVGRAHRDRP